MNRRWLGIILLLGAAAAFGGERYFQEHAAMMDSLSRVHPRMRASWLKERGVDDPYYTTVRKPESTGLKVIGRWSYGPSYDVDGRVTPSETLVALARGSGVSLLRFSRQDSLSIELLSDINAEGLMCRVKVVDTLLYVGSRKGLEVYNIADEQNPVRLSWTPIPLNDFALQDSLVYTISGDDSFRIYNVSNPADPVFLGACRDSGDLVSVAGNAAFLGDRWGLYVIDVSNPASPHRIGAWGSAIEQVQARGHLCYVTTFNPNVPGEITFHILDVSTPASPYQIGSLDSAGGNDVCLVDTLAFGAGENDFNKLTVVSVADSTRPRLVGSAVTRGWSMGIWASGLAQSAFVGCHWEGLQVYDTRNTSQPVRDTFLLGADQSVDIYIDNARAYVANEMAGLWILDVSDPARPTALGSYDTTWQRPFMSSVVARDSFAFVDWWDRPSLRVMDVAVPSRPTPVGGADVTNTPQDMVIRDSFIYVAEIARLQVVNIARPREPVLVGTCTGDGVAVVVQDSFAYTAAGAIRITNVARPDSPFVVGTITGPSGSGLAVRDTFLYVPQAYDTLWVYSVASPSAPRLLGFAPVGTHCWDVALGESQAAVATVQGLVLFSLSNAAQPTRLGSVTTPYGPRRVCYVAPYWYAAMFEAGVGIYEAESTGIGERGSVSLHGNPALLSAMPNPTSGLVTLGPVRGGISTHVAVRDAMGRLVGVRQLEVGVRPGQSRLSLAGCAAGLYFVELFEGDRRVVLKVVKR